MNALDPHHDEPDEAADKRDASCCSSQEAAPADARTAIDPVCGMNVDKATATYVATHEGEITYFCSAGCRDKFMADPARWTKAKTSDHVCSCGTANAADDAVTPHTQSDHDHHHGQACC